MGARISREGSGLEHNCNPVPVKWLHNSGTALAIRILLVLEKEWVWSTILVVELKEMNRLWHHRPMAAKHRLDMQTNCYCTYSILIMLDLG